MDRKKLEEMIVEYLGGEMDAAREAEFRQLLAEHGYSIGDLSEFEELYAELETVEVPEPSEKMHTKFYAMLEGYAQHQQSESILNRFADRIRLFFDRRTMLRLAYSLALIVIGWGIGYKAAPEPGYNEQLIVMSGQIRELRSMMMLTMLEQPSAAERIKAVSQVEDINQVDKRVIDALLHTLNSDPNVNVRLVTLETLYRAAGDPKVRSGLVESIGRQDSPIMQLALAEIMVAMQEKNSIGELNALLERRDLYYGVRNEIEKAVDSLML